MRAVLQKQLACTKYDFIGGQLPDGNGRLREAFVGQVRRIGEDNFECGIELFAARVCHLNTESLQNSEQK